MKKHALLIGSALAALAVASACHHKTAAKKDAGMTMAKGECHSINACKGQGACGGADHECAGKNTCKGQGWLSLTDGECKAQGGTFKNK